METSKNLLTMDMACLLALIVTVMAPAQPVLDSSLEAATVEVTTPATSEPPSSPAPDVILLLAAACAIASIHADNACTAEPQ